MTGPDSDACYASQDITEASKEQRDAAKAENDSAERAWLDAESVLHDDENKNEKQGWVCVSNAPVELSNPVGCAIRYVENNLMGETRAKEAKAKYEAANRAFKDSDSRYRAAKKAERAACRLTGCGSRGGKTVRNPDTGKCEGSRPCNRDD